FLQHRRIGTPYIEPARPQCVGESGCLEAAVGVVERRVNRAGIDGEAHRGTMNVRRMPSILRSLLIALPLLAVACGSADSPHSQAVTGAAAQRQTEPERRHASRRIVFLGDSLTAGLGLPREQSTPSLIQDRLTAEGYDYEVINAGVSGDTSAGGLSRLDWSLDGDVEILVIELGANDGLRGLPIAQMKRN